ncbi:MAG: complex I NDUFA9 subunit family protein [Firmicutes bacterium]|nr:complex I NDUFA9 subunit family protein [Bacillota bacterium]
MFLVTGATGFVGRHLVKTLLKEGFSIRCLVRSTAAARDLHSVELIQGDVTDPSTLRAACVGLEGVIHLVAVIREKGDATFFRVNVQGTCNLLAAAEAAGVRRFIHMSALGARDDPAYRYVYSKWLAEEAVRNCSMHWTIFRPSLIYGEGFGFFDRLIQSVRMFPPPFVPLPGGGKTRFQPVAVDDLVCCVVKSLKAPGFEGRVCEIGGPEHLSYAQMLDALMDTLHIRRIKVPVPLPLMRVVVPLMGVMMEDPPVTTVELRQLDHDNVTDPDAVEKQFGFKPRRLCDGFGFMRDKKW